MEFERGQTKGYVRFVEENAAIDLAAKIKEKLGETEKLKIKEAEIEFRYICSFFLKKFSGDECFAAFA